MSDTPFIDDETFSNLVKDVLKKVSSARAKKTKDLYKNALDPFSAVFDAAANGQTVAEWFEDEANRQIQKTLQNAIGAFHQKLLGSMPGWEDMKAGGAVDLRSADRKIVAEIKNKHNTMNSASAESTFNKLSNWLRYKDKGFKAYVVAIVPKSTAAYDRPWTHSKKLSPTRDDIRTIDGKSFYALVSGDPDALAKIYKKLRVELAKQIGDKNNALVSDADANLIFEKTFGV